jgi:hypothetical protein
MVLLRLRSRTAVVEQPAPSTLEDLLVEAHQGLRFAEVEFAEAHLAVNQFYVRNRDFLPIKEVAGQVTLTIKLPNAELAALLSRENAAIASRAKAMARWSDLKEKVDSRESRHIAGVRV